MSERIYAWLLRLYPRRFRDTYGDEALQLFRDRARDTHGAFETARLWLDLAADLAVSVPRQHRAKQPARVGAPSQQVVDGIPSFHVLKGESPSLQALFCGGALSLLALVALSLASRHSGVVQPFRYWIAQSGNANPMRPQAPLPQPQDFPKAPTRAAIADFKLNDAERHRVIAAAIANLNAHYIDPQIARKIADALLAHEKRGDYKTLTDGGVFADLLTKHMRDASDDRHLDIDYSNDTLPEHLPEPPPGVSPPYRPGHASK